MFAAERHEVVRAGTELVEREQARASLFGLDELATVGQQHRAQEKRVRLVVGAGGQREE